MSIHQQALEKLEQLGEEAASEATGVSIQSVRAWLRTKSIPGKQLDAILEAELPEPEEGASIIDETESQDATDTRLSGTTELTDTEAKLQDLHERVELLENQMAAAVGRGVDQQGGGGNRALVPSYQGAQRQDTRNGVGYAVQPGRAPTREQAHNSGRGGRGRTAGPAQPRTRQPGAFQGNKMWNVPKPSVKK